MESPSTTEEAHRESLRRAEDVLQRSPTNRDALVSKAEALSALGSLYFQRGLRAFSAAVRERDRVEAEAGDSGNDATVDLAPGRKLISQAGEFYRQAVTAFDDVLQREETASFFVGKARAVRGVAQSISYTSRDSRSRETHLTEAVDAYEEAIRLDGTDVETLTNAAAEVHHLAAVKDGPAQQALRERSVELFEHALSLDPNHTRALGLYAGALQSMTASQDRDRAVETFGRVLDVYERLLEVESRPRFYLLAKAESLLDRSSFLADNGLLDLALEDCQDALGLLAEAGSHEQGTSEVLEVGVIRAHAGAFTRMGDVLARLGHIDQAVDAFHGAIEWRSREFEVTAREFADRGPRRRDPPSTRRERGVAFLRLAELLIATDRQSEARVALEEAREDLSHAHEPFTSNQMLEMTLERVDRLLEA